MSDSSSSELDNFYSAQDELNKVFKKLNLEKSRYESVLEDFNSIDLVNDDRNLLERRKTTSTSEQADGQQHRALRDFNLIDIDLNKTIRSYSYFDLTDDSEVWESAFKFDQQQQEEKKMAQAIEDLVRRLAEMQLRQQAINPGDVIRNCHNIIIKFEKTNMINFLESVELAMSTTDRDEHKLTILKFAKQRVLGSVTIASKEYVTFASFKTDLLAVFKPKRTVTEIESIIARLAQQENDSVDAFGKKVVELKFEYEQASQAERLAENAVLDEIRLKEMEKKIARAFMNGLKDFIIRFVSERPNTLSEAISVALEAESTSLLRFQNKKLAEQSGKKKWDRTSMKNRGERNDSRDLQKNHSHKSHRNFSKNGEKPNV